MLDLFGTCFFFVYQDWVMQLRWVEQIFHFLSFPAFSDFQRNARMCINIYTHIHSFF